jgi:hypothetical protein
VLGGTFPQPVGGLSVDATSLILRRAIKGDVNLSGTVDFADLLVLAQNFGLTGTQVWTGGDFNFDGAVDFTDLLAMAQSYGVSTLADGTLSTAAGNFDADWALARSTVPEPTTLLLVPAAIVAMRRRRSRSM